MRGLGTVALYIMFGSSLGRAASPSSPPESRSALATPDLLGLPISSALPRELCSNGVVGLGEKLFKDSRLSGDQRVSCGTCHQPARAFSDGRPVAQGIGGQLGTRNTPTLVNASLLSTFSWEGRRSSLEEQVLDPFTHSREHGLASSEALLQALKANGVISLSQAAGALACYVQSLAAGDSAFDRFFYGGEKTALSEAQQRGLKLFQEKARCASCHLILERDAPFTDNKFHAAHIDAKVIQALPRLLPLVQSTPRDKLAELVASRADVAALGRFLVTGEPNDVGRFRTPTLRNVALTAPYMHDGQVPTLADAVEREAYYRTQQLGRPFALTPAERDDLVSFLESLTSRKYAVSTSQTERGSRALH